MPSLRLLRIAALAVFGLGCASPQGNGGPTGTGGGGTDPTGTGGASPGSGGGAQGTGGTGPTDGFDNGNLFGDAAPLMPPGSGGSGPTDGPAAEGGSGIPGDGNMATAKVDSLGLAAVFSQKGTEVTLVVTATRCPPGPHTIHLHEGFACDDPTNKPIWGGSRGDGIGTLTCAADQKGTLTHVRPATNPATKWTVGDQSLVTDVTLHPIFIDGRSCGTFF